MDELESTSPEGNGSDNASDSASERSSELTLTKVDALASQETAVASSRTRLPAAAQSLPLGVRLEEPEAHELALREGFSTTSVDLARSDGRSTVGQRLRTVLLMVPFVALVAYFFPTERFFKAPLKPMADVALAVNLTPQQVAAADEPERPMLEARRMMESLAAEGNLPDAIAHAESVLAEVPPEEREAWREVYYRYWEYLEKSVRYGHLEKSVRKYIGVDPNDPVFAWYYARIFNRKVAMGQQTSTGDSRQILTWLEAAQNRLTYQLEGGGASGDALGHRRDLIRLEEARLHHNLWKLYGYPKEKKSPGLAHRDEAIRICTVMESELEAQRLLLNIYDRVIDQWWFFERSEVLGDEAYEKPRLKARRDALRAAIEDAIEMEKQLER